MHKSSKKLKTSKYLKKLVNKNNIQFSKEKIDSVGLEIQLLMLT